MNCKICGMPPIPEHQLRRDDLPICFSGHTLVPPVALKKPQEVEVVLHAPKGPQIRHVAENGVARGKEIKKRIVALKISVRKMSSLCQKGETSGYSVVSGKACESLVKTFEEKLTELEQIAAQKMRLI